MGDRREQMTIVGPDFRLRRRSAEQHGRFASQRFGDRNPIRSASSSECSKSIWQRIRLFQPNELATDVVLRSAPAVSSATLL